ncbi:transcription factor S [Candidatus Woesearchaeota archaeon]|jgi:DNA-directed RNA polymerase subunit M|nr:transcription factor S [Candidatus Woesearchaeota archaeon]
MLFCPKCGSLLKPKQEKGKRILFCSCGFTKKDLEGAEIKETLNKQHKEIEVVSEDEDKMLPLMDANCPKCKHKKAYYWLVQTRAGDEPETKFLKCEKCKSTWRDYS